MKNIVFCMNCHAGYIIRNINRYNHKIIEDYSIHHINYAQNNYLIDNKLTDNDIKLIKNADILILQYIKSDRDMLNHDYIKKITNTDNIYLIPHYTFNGYFNNDIINDIIIKYKTVEQITTAVDYLNVNTDTILYNLNIKINFFIIFKFKNAYFNHLNFVNPSLISVLSSTEKQSTVIFIR